jgi:hypothetical protein
LILVAASYLKDALPDERPQRVPDLAFAPLRHVFCHGLAQAELFVDLGQPSEPTVTGQTATVEGNI